MKNWLLLILFISVNVFSQTDTLTIKKEGRFKVAGKAIKNGFLSIPGDFTEMGKSFSDDWTKTAIYAGGIVGLIAVDKYTTSFLKDKIEPTIDYSLPNIDAVNFGKGYRFNNLLRDNNAYMTYPIIGLYAGSLIANYGKGQTVAINAFKAVAYSYVISHLILKTVFARNRPNPDGNLFSDDLPRNNYTKDNWDFGNFHPVYFSTHEAGTSFPSYHATTYFTLAKVIQMEYNNYWIPYTFATVIFMAELKDHNHWVSDLVVGGLIGTVIGRSVVKSSRKQLSKSDTSSNKLGFLNLKMQKQLVPQISRNSVGLHFIGTF